MKKVVLMVVCLMFVASVVVAAPRVIDPSWSITVGGKTYTAVSDSVLIDINGKTTLRVWRCGQVEVQQFREVVPNKDETTSMWTISNGSIITVPSWYTGQ